MSPSVRQAACSTTALNAIVRNLTRHLRAITVQRVTRSFLVLAGLALVSVVQLTAQNAPTAANWAMPPVYATPGSGATATGALTSMVSGTTNLVGGSGYTTAAPPSVNITCSGVSGCLGSGATATATVNGSGVVSAITITAAGSGYVTSAPPAVKFSCTGSCTGSGVSATVALTTPAFTNVTVTNGGSGYAIAPSVVFSAPGGTGSSALGFVTVTSGAVLGVTITNPGSGYSSAPTVMFTSNPPAYQNGTWVTQPAIGQIGFTFTVPSTPFRSTSAVVVNPSTNVLIRTLWMNRAYPTGTWGEIWDGKDDYGTPQTAGSYLIKLQTNNVSYTWDGIIGNTENDWGGPNNWDNSGSFPRAIAFTPALTYNSVNYPAQGCEAGGYNEQFYGIYCFPTATPNTNIRPQTTKYTDESAADIAWDGTHYYELFNSYDTAAGSPAAYLYSEIIAFNPDGSIYKFTNTASPQIGYGSPTDGSSFENGSVTPTIYEPEISVVDLSDNASTTQGGVASATSITGVAVESGSGNILVTGHGEYLPQGWSGANNPPGYTGSGSIGYVNTPVASQDKIYFWNKTTGASLGSSLASFTVPNPQKMAFDKNDNLWIVSGFGTNDTIYEVTGIDTGNYVLHSPLSNITLPGLPANRVLSNPMSLSVSPLTGNIFIMDGGSNQQVVEFNPNTFAVVSTLGTVGGFITGTTCNPTVTNTTFDFDPGTAPILAPDLSSTGIPSITAAHLIGQNGPWTSAISIDQNGDLWVMDQPNERVMHYTYQSGAWTYVNRIMKADWTYQAAVANGDPTRIFGGFLGFDEYSRNYSLPLQAGDPEGTNDETGHAGNGGWNLVRNWLPCVLAANTSWNASQAIINAFTLPNNYTVMQAVGERWDTDSAAQSITAPANPTTLYMFNTDGSLVYQNGYTGSLSPINRLSVIQPTTGNVYSQVRSNVYTGSTLTGYTYTIGESAVTGYTSAHFPNYPTTPTNVASYTSTFAAGVPRNSPSITGMWPSANNIIPMFDTTPETAATGPAFHLGGLAVGGTSLQWKSMPQASIPYSDGNGSYPAASAGPQGQQFNGGTLAMAIGNNVNNIGNIFAFYNGNWTGWGCQYYHFTDDGLFVGQFGYLQNAAANLPGTAPFFAEDYPAKQSTAILGQGMCGDVGDPVYVTDPHASDAYYVFIGDEGYHKGIHEWHVQNLNSIAEIKQTLTTAVASTTSVSPSLSSTTYGQVVTLTATVTPSTATGTVTFAVGSTTLGTATLSSGVATLPTTALPVGSDTVTATYNQNPSYAPSSGTVGVTISPAATTLTPTGSSVAATFGQSITLTATVVAPGTSYVPTGTVAFKTGANYSILLGTGTLNGSGFTTVNSTNAPIGADGITAFYTPTGTDFTASQGEIHITVQQGITGTVYAGTTPVSGATIQLYQVGVGSSQNYLANAIELVGYAVTTSSSGAFSITGEYTCTPGTYVYATASGGNAGPGTNPNLALMASVGPCANLANAITINEVTTVAAAYAFAQFSADSDFGTALTSAPGSTTGASTAAINIATSSTNVVGIANAAQIAQLLASPSGASPGSNGNGAFTSPMKVGLSTGDSTGAVAEFWQINTIANMLDACVKTTGGVYSNTSTNCGMLFANVQAAAGTNPVTNAAYAPPADTIQAAVYLALTPAVATAQITNLAPLASKFGTFTPYVSSASAIVDYTVAIQFIPVIPTTTTTNLLTQPTAVSIDSNGNAWVINQAGSGTYVTTAIELSPTGVPMQAGTTAGTSPNNYLLSTYTMGGGSTTFGGQLIYNQTAEAWQSVGYLDAALDTNNNLWLNDRRNDSEVEIVGSGAYGSGTSQNGGNAGDSGGHGAVGFQLPTGSAPDLTKIDAQNDIWIYLNGLVTGGVEGTGTFSNTCGTSYTGYNTGLVGFLGESSTNVVYGGPITPNGLDGDAFAAIDPLASLDKTTAGPIQGAPFLWTSFGLYLYQNYTQAASTVPAGCYTPLQTIGNAGSNSGAVTYLPGTPNTPVTGDTTYATGDQNYDVAFDNGGNLWISALKAIDSESTIKSAFIKLAPNYGSAFTSAQADANFTFNYFHNVAGITDSGSVQARFMAIDGAGDVWFTYNPRETVGEVNNQGIGLSPTGTTPGFAGSTCTNCSYAGGAAETYSRNTGGPRRPAIDLSGNVWLAQEETNSIGILMLVGAAPPTGNPISLALKNGTVGKKP